MINAPQPNQIIGCEDEEHFHKSRKSGFDCFYKNVYVFINGVKTLLTQQRRFPDSPFQSGESFVEREIEELHASLFKSKWKYSHETCYQDPFELLKYMDMNDFRFNQMFRVYELEGGFEVGGNLIQVSCVFNYRFFCRETLDKWIKQAKSISPISDYSISQAKFIFP